MEVYATLDKNNNVIEWKTEVVSTFKAYERKRQKKPVVQREFGAGKRFLFSLALNEAIVFNGAKIAALAPNGGPLNDAIREAAKRFTSCASFRNKSNFANIRTDAKAGIDGWLNQAGHAVSRFGTSQNQNRRSRERFLGERVTSGKLARSVVERFRRRFLPTRALNRRFTENEKFRKKAKRGAVDRATREKNE